MFALLACVNGRDATRTLNISRNLCSKLGDLRSNQLCKFRTRIERAAASGGFFFFQSEPLCRPSLVHRYHFCTTITKRSLDDRGSRAATILAVWKQFQSHASTENRLRRFRAPANSCLGTASWRVHRPDAAYRCSYEAPLWQLYRAGSATGGAFSNLHFPPPPATWDRAHRAALG